MSRVFALQVGDLDLFFDTTYSSQTHGEWSLSTKSRVNPEHSQLWNIHPAPIKQSNRHCKMWIIIYWKKKKSSWSHTNNMQVNKTIEEKGKLFFFFYHTRLYSGFILGFVPRNPSWRSQGWNQGWPMCKERIFTLYSASGPEKALILLSNINKYIWWS